MTNQKQVQLYIAIDAIESQLQYVKNLINEAIPKQDWIDTKEFAKRVNRKHRTITNYVGKGHFNNFKKMPNGQYLIHVSELSKWTN